jgi:uncharacterized protein (DUF1330 family)
MKAYVIAVETIHDEAMFEAYKKQVLATLEPFGARFVVRGGQQTVVEGDWPHKRMAVIEFPSRAEAEGWYASPAYQAVIGLRLGSSTGSLVIVDGPA